MKCMILRTPKCGGKPSSEQVALVHLDDSHRRSVSMVLLDDDERQRGSVLQLCKDSSSEVGFRTRSWPEDASDMIYL